MTLPLSDHFNGKTFSNRDHANRSLLDLLRWRFGPPAARWPERVPLEPQPPPPDPRPREIVATWINHATFLLRTARGNFLTDPIFGERASPVAWAGPRRVHPPGLALAALPKIDFVLLSHDHYDHCHLASLREIAAQHDPVFLTPLRYRDLLAQVGITRVVELDWWQTHALGNGESVTFTPARHWSNRLGAPRNSRLWGGFVVESDERRFYFAGDTGYDAEMFREIRRRCGAPDVALLPIGAYEPRWFMSIAHMNPAEAVAAHRDLEAKLSVAMHWGCWQLTDEAREAPVHALVEALEAAKVEPSHFRVLAPGATLVA
jgi:L-ascorbate metabolism protein UlaG (beta-lactamase superfamily)